MLNIILLLVFISFSATMYYLIAGFPSRGKTKERMDFYMNENHIVGRNKYQVNQKTKEEKKFVARFVAALIKNGIFFQKYINSQKKLIFDARIDTKIEEYIGLKLVISMIWCILLYLLLSESPVALIGSLLSTPIAFILPDFFLKMKIQMRMKKLNSQLGDALRIMSNALKAGNGFFQAMDMMVKEMDGPVTEEFEVVLSEIRLGQTIETSLENLSKRIDNAELGMVVTAVLIQRQSGGNLSEILDKIAETIRGRISLQRELASATAQGKMSATIISLLPVALFAYCMLLNRETYSVLLTTTIGNVMLIGSLVMELTGIFFIKKIISVKV